MTRYTTIITLVMAAVLMITALGRPPGAKADDDDEDEKPITSNAAQLSRDAAGHVLITMRPAAQEDVGIATEILKPDVRPIEIEAYGFILDPASLATLNSDLLSAQAALSAARAEYRRTGRLYAGQRNASLRDLQTAQASYLIDKSRMEALEQQLRNNWGEDLARMAPEARSRFVSALVDRREALARVTAPIGEQWIDTTSTAQIFPIGHENQPITSQAIYAAPTAVPTLQGQSFLARIATTRFPVRPGMAVSARIPISNASRRGVMVPRRAIVRYAGSEWVYRQLSGNRFVRVGIAPAEITRQGYFVTENLMPGARIVVAGAQALLSQELKAEIQVED